MNDIYLILHRVTLKRRLKQETIRVYPFLYQNWSKQERIYIDINWANFDFKAEIRFKENSLTLSPLHRLKAYAFNEAVKPDPTCFIYLEHI